MDFQDNYSDKYFFSYFTEIGLEIDYLYQRGIGAFIQTST